MKGELAEAVSLVSYGNAFLQEVTAAAFPAWRTHSAFRYVNLLEFAFESRPRWWIMAQSSVVARTPDEWLEWLRRRNTVALRLRFSRDRGAKTLPAQPPGRRRSAGGGGGRRPEYPAPPPRCG